MAGAKAALGHNEGGTYICNIDRVCCWKAKGCVPIQPALTHPSSYHKLVSCHPPAVDDEIRHLHEAAR